MKFDYDHYSTDKFCTKPEECDTMWESNFLMRVCWSRMPNYGTTQGVDYSARGGDVGNE